MFGVRYRCESGVKWVKIPTLEGKAAHANNRLIFKEIQLIAIVYAGIVDLASQNPTLSAIH